MIFSAVTSNLRIKYNLMFEHCLRAQSKVKKPFRLIFYLHKSELRKTIEMLSLLSRVGGQTENSIKSAAAESLTEIRLTARKLGVRKNVHGIDH